MPNYDYFCEGCFQVWSAFYKMDERKTPEHNPCPKCGVVGTVQQTVAYTNVPLSATLEADRSTKKLNNSAFAEKLNMIHQNNPGSNLDKASSIVTVK